jgi:uncharacterized protein (DUF362 family)
MLVPDLLSQVLPDLAGKRVLIKPNFVALRNASLSCTDARIIFAAARHCLERGALVSIGDSPAFGTAQAIAQAIGLTDMLRPLDLAVTTLKRGRWMQSGTVRVPVSAEALDADLILNLPKFKAHSQMRFSGAVKNLFGCVTGVHKAWLHARHGDRQGRFTEMISGLLQILPPVASLMDGVKAMHRTGPIAGEPFALGLLGASTSPVALDAAAGMVLDAQPGDFPVWKQCLAAGLPGADPAELFFPRAAPHEFDAHGFVLPVVLKPESFRPDVLLKSLCKRLWLARGKPDGTM